TRPGPAGVAAATERRDPGSTALAPPGSRPWGGVLPATGIRPAVRSADTAVSSMPIRSSRVPETRAAGSGRSGAGAGVSGMGPRVSCVSRLLLDGHSLAYRAFFALPVENFSTTTGQPTNAVYGFTSMLINVLRDEAPTHLGVAFDVSRQSFRTQTYAEYKAGRQESPPDFAGQVSLIQEVLAALRIPAVSLPGYEADDVIATLAAQGRAAGMQVLITTGDRDALQLVDDRVT